MITAMALFVMGSFHTGTLLKDCIFQGLSRWLERFVKRTYDL